MAQADAATANWCGRTVVITGASGFVAAHVVPRLLDEGARVVAWLRPGGTDAWRLESRADEVEWIEVDLLSVGAIARALDAAAPSAIIHLATHYAVDNEVDLADMIDTNIKAGALLVRACRGRDGLDILVNAGTCAEYGDCREPADETTRLNPNNAYASTKAAQTMVMMQLGRDLGVPVTTLRLYNMYGEWEKPARLVPATILALMRGERLSLTAGEQAKDYSYVGDVASALVAAAADPEAAIGEVFNIGSGSTVTMRDLVEEIADHFPDGTSLLDFGARPYRPDEMWYQATSIKKAGAVLDWRPQTDLHEGIARVVEWYREHADEYEHHDD